MLTDTQREQLPRWEQARQRYAAAGESRLQSVEDKLARRVSAVIGMRNPDKHLAKWEAEHDLAGRPDATLWERVMTMVAEERGLDTSCWFPVALDGPECYGKFDDLPEKAVLVCWMRRSETAAVMYELDDDVYADELPMPCALRKAGNGRTIITCKLEGIVNNG